jgi:hypothetical protein
MTSKLVTGKIYFRKKINDSCWKHEDARINEK